MWLLEVVCRKLGDADEDDDDERGMGAKTKNQKPVLWKGKRETQPLDS